MFLLFSSRAKGAVVKMAALLQRNEAMPTSSRHGLVTDAQ